MSRLSLVSLSVIIFVGCGGGSFTDLGNGVGVPSESISNYAEAHGLTHDEAHARMRDESDQERVAEHAEKYGVSNEEARGQVEPAAH